MGDVYISCAHADYAAARALADALRDMGLRVRLSVRLMGNDAFEAPPYELASASAVVVLWSRRSVKSEWVRRELDEAVSGGTPVFAVLLDRVAPPSPFTKLVATDLSEWTGSGDSMELHLLADAIRAKTGGGATERAVTRTGDTGSVCRADLERALKRTKVAVNSPRTVGAVWETVRGYLYPASDESRVRHDAKSLRPAADARHTTAQAEVSEMRAGTRISVIMHLPGVECRRNEQRFIWRGRWHKTDFKVRYRGQPVTALQEGTISWFAGMVCVGQVSFQIEFAPQSGERRWPASLATAPGYESVFVSYSTRDSAIVEWLETSYAALGMTYLRDVKSLRSGETWDKQLLQLIERADLFQLCWSANAKQSPYVADEWRFALGLQKANFIRPCYWEDPMPEPPPELRKIHFTRLKLSWWMRLWFRLHARFV